MSCADLMVMPMDTRLAGAYVKQFHYAHRIPPISMAFQLTDAEIMGAILGVVCFGSPASRRVQMSACKSNPDAVIELSRLWIADIDRRNKSSYLVSRALRKLPPLIVVSYADTAQKHNGYIYRAANFKYAGATGERTDKVHGKIHPRHTDATKNKNHMDIVARKPKHRYWTVTGTKRDRRDLSRIVTWPDIQWGELDVCIQ